MRRRHLTLALVVSVLVHGVLGVWLATQPKRAQPIIAVTPTAPEWVAVELAGRNPSLDDALGAGDRPSETHRVHDANRRKSAMSHSGNAPIQGKARSTTPRLILNPRLDGGSSSGFAVPQGGGRTLYPGDPSLSDEAARAESEHRVGERVKEWVGHTLAEARAQRGLPHPYFARMADSARRKLDSEARAQKMTADVGQLLAGMATRYTESTERYGKTGNPGLGPPGAAPRASERLREKVGDSAGSLPMRLLVQASETAQDLKSGRPLLTLTLELWQSGDGQRQRMRVLQSSGDQRFDGFVLRVWPSVFADVGVPPPSEIRGDGVRTVWAVEGWPRMPKKLDEALAYVPRPFGLPLPEAGMAVMAERSQYEFRTRLLRVY